MVHPDELVEVWVPVLGLKGDLALQPSENVFCKVLIQPWVVLAHAQQGHDVPLPNATSCQGPAISASPHQHLDNMFSRNVLCSRMTGGLLMSLKCCWEHEGINKCVSLSCQLL